MVNLTIFIKKLWSIWPTLKLNVVKLTIIFHVDVLIDFCFLNDFLYVIFDVVSFKSGFSSIEQVFKKEKLKLLIFWSLAASLMPHKWYFSKFDFKYCSNRAANFWRPILKLAHLLINTVFSSFEQLFKIEIFDFRYFRAHFLVDFWKFWLFMKFCFSLKGRFL